MGIFVLLLLFVGGWLVYEYKNPSPGTEEKRKLEKELFGRLSAIPDNQWEVGLNNYGPSFTAKNVYIRKREIWADGPVVPTFTMGRIEQGGLFLRGFGGILDLVYAIPETRKHFSPYVGKFYDQLCKRFRSQITSLVQDRFNAQVGLPA